VSVHQVGFNFDLYKMHSEYNIKKKNYFATIFFEKKKNLPGELKYIRAKFHPRTGWEGTEEEESSTVSLTSAPDGGGCSKPHHGRFTLGTDTCYPFYRRLGGPRCRPRTPNRSLKQVGKPTTLPRSSGIRHIYKIIKHIIHCDV
jgi:hypothetical protein